MISTRHQRIRRSCLGVDNSGVAEIFKRIESSQRRLDFTENRNKHWFAATLGLNQVDGSGKWECYKYAEDFFVLVSDFCCVETRRDTLRGTGLLDIHIKLEGETTIYSSGNKPLQVNAPCLLAGTHPKGQKCHLQIAPKKETSVTLYFKPEYFYDNLASQMDDIPIALANFIFNHSRRVHNIHLPISNEIIEAAHAIVHSSKRFKHKLRLSHVHGRSEELICYVIDMFYRSDHNEQDSFKQSDISLLRQAKNLIEQHIDAPLTTQQLAKVVGTNQTYLKQGFKSLFGETLFEYKNRLRMQKAHSLILQGLPIASVSEQIGYQQQASFARAFKAYYGFNARDCRKRS